jgi:hypothetical protein
MAWGRGDRMIKCKCGWIGKEDDLFIVESDDFDPIVLAETCPECGNAKDLEEIE